MENASKALLIAAGILIGIIVITMIIYAYGQVANYYKTKEETKESEQIAEFNKQFIGYNRDDVRGSDLLSLVNKIIDYNQPKMNDVNEEKIEITITIGKNDVQKLFCYDNPKNIKIIKSSYTQEDINAELVTPANNIESRYTQAMATKLAANISTLMGENTRKEPKDLFIELKINVSDYGGLEVIQKEILQYYQYQQFKRAHFKCTELKYKDGRVKSFKFEFNGTFE